MADEVRPGKSGTAGFRRFDVRVPPRPTSAGAPRDSDYDDNFNRVREHGDWEKPPPPPSTPPASAADGSEALSKAADAVRRLDLISPEVGEDSPPLLTGDSSRAIGPTPDSDLITMRVSPLYEAIDGGDTEAVKSLAQKHPTDLSLLDGVGGHTPLEAVVYSNRLPDETKAEMVMHLYDYEYDLEPAGDAKLYDYSMGLVESAVASGDAKTAVALLRAANNDQVKHANIGLDNISRLRDRGLVPRHAKALYQELRAFDKGMKSLRFQGSSDGSAMHAVSRFIGSIRAERGRLKDECRALMSR